MTGRSEQTVWHHPIYKNWNLGELVSIAYWSKYWKKTYTSEKLRRDTCANAYLAFVFCVCFLWYLLQHAMILCGSVITLMRGKCEPIEACKGFSLTRSFYGSIRTSRHVFKAITVQQQKAAQCKTARPEFPWDLPMVVGKSYLSAYLCPSRDHLLRSLFF